MVTELSITTKLDRDKRGVIFPNLKSELTISQIGKILGLDNVGRLAFEMERCKILRPLEAYAQKKKYSQRDMIKIFAASRMVEDGHRVCNVRYKFVGIFPYDDYIPGVLKILENRRLKK